MNFSLVFSLLLHLGFIFLASLNIRLSKEDSLKDKGFVVYEFKEIGPKSKAPIISDQAGHVSKTTAKKNDAEEKMKVKKTIQTEANKKEEPKVTKDVSIEKKKDLLKQKSKKQAPPKKQKKNESSKKTDKAVVDLKRNKKGSINANKNAKKKSFDSILNDVMATSDNENEGVKAEEVGEALTATQVDLIRQTIRKCWHVPAGLKNAEDLTVDIKMELDKDGRVKKAEIQDKARMKSDPDYKIAAENAYRAVMDPKCNPLPLPPDRYKDWKDLELSFNPKDMF